MLIINCCVAFHCRAITRHQCRRRRQHHRSAISPRYLAFTPQAALASLRGGGGNGLRPILTACGRCEALCASVGASPMDARIRSLGKALRAQRGYRPIRRCAPGAARHRDALRYSMVTTAAAAVRVALGCCADAVLALQPISPSLLRSGLKRRQPAVRRMMPTFAASLAANNLRTRRMQLIISA